jgi:hypothetical protein
MNPAGCPALHWRWQPGAVALAAALAFMAVAAAAYAPLPELAFRSDHSPVSWLSSAQLWGLALLSVQLGSQRLLPRALATWLALALLLLAFDEQFLWHEQWKHGCPLGPAWCAQGWLRELPMLLVGLFGAATAWWLQRSLPGGAARATLWAALAVGGLALVLDQTEAPAWLAPGEEAFEVLAEALFGAALLGLTCTPPDGPAPARTTRP